MIRHFKAYRDTGFGLFLLVVCLILFFLTIGFPLIQNGKLITFDYFLTVCISVPIVFLFSWIWFATRYTIVEDMLKIKHGPLKYEIPVADVLEIRLNQKTPGLLKACLSFKCIVIIYGKYKSIFISPVNTREFVNILKEINNDIVIKNK